MSVPQKGLPSSSGRHSEAPSDFDLLCLMFSKVLKPRDCAKAAQALLNRFGALKRVLGADDEEWRNLDCVPDLAVEELMRTRLLVRSIFRTEIENRPLLDDLDSVRRFARATLCGKPREEFHALFLDNTYHLLKHECVQTGTVNHVTVYPREVMSRALALNARYLILVHNHPDGLSMPSRQDIEMTRYLRKAGQLLEVSILDHIIVGSQADFSFLQNGLLKDDQD